MTPVVSVVMPNYNKSQFIASAIESVLAQTMSDFELIVVDDASTDSSASIVEARWGGDSRVVLIRLKLRGGAAHARNVGVSAANAPAIAFLDSDDLYHPEALELMGGALRTSPSPVVAYSDYWLLDADGGRMKPWPKACTSSGMILKEVMVGGLAVQANLVAPRAALRQAGPFDESITWGEDTDMIFRLAERFPFIYVDRQLYGYRLHSGNIWNTMSARQRLEAKTPIIEKYFRANKGALDTETRRTVKRRLFRDYYRAHRYWKALTISISTPLMFPV